MSGMTDGEREETEGVAEKAAVEEEGAEIEPGVTASIMEAGARSPGFGCLQLANSTDTLWNAKGEALLCMEIPLSLMWALNRLEEPWEPPLFL